MRNLDIYLKNKVIDYKKLDEYGFEKIKDNYVYHKRIIDNQFEVIISFGKENISKVIDLENDDEYILVDVENSVGEFVGKVREEYENIIQEVVEECTNLNVFKNKQTKQIIKYIKEKYNDDLEFLWEKYDGSAIWRNKSNNKWYGLLMTITEDKLGLKSNKEIEVLNLKYQKDETNKVIDNKGIFPGYHMNKKSWISIKLDDNMQIKYIKGLINNSYKLSLGNKCGIGVDELSNKVYNYLTQIPKGKVVTYGQIAQYLGNKGLARVVGSILHKNPDENKYPCYKVLNSKGELAEAFVFGGKEKQKKMLEKDGIKVVDDKVDLKLYQWKN